MRTFIKKSSLCLVLALLMLLTGILVGTAITVSADEPVAYEAAVFKGESEKYTGTLEECVAWATANTADAPYVVKMFNDAEIDERLSIAGSKISKLDGQGHTIYIGTTINVIGNSYLISVANTTFENVNLVGQSKAWADTLATTGVVDWAAAGSFGKATDMYNGGIVVGQNTSFTMIGCTMKYFQHGGRRGACIAWSSVHGTGNPRSYSDSWGIYLIDTVITDNYMSEKSAGRDGNAIFLSSSQATNWGPKIHVSGNTIVENNFDWNGNQANIFVERANQSTAPQIQASVLVIEPDFTGRVGIIKESGSNAHILNEVTKRGCVFYKADANGNIATKGTVFVNNYESFSVPVGTENDAVAFIDLSTIDEAVGAVGSSAYTGYWADRSTDWPTETVTLTVRDKANTKDLMVYEVSLKCGDALPAWATWSGHATKHVFGVEAYTGIAVNDTGFLRSTDNGKTWFYSADLTNGIDSCYEALGDYVLGATLTLGMDTSGENVVVIDFNGYTFSRADKTYRFKWSGNNNPLYKMNVTIKNANIDGTIGGEVPTDAYTFLVSEKQSKLTLENCTISNFISKDVADATDAGIQQRGSVVAVRSGSTQLILDNVTTTNCYGSECAFYIVTGSVTLKGNTNVCYDVTDEELTDAQKLQSILMTNCDLYVDDSFTGKVFLYVNDQYKNLNAQMAQASNMAADATLKGMIASMYQPDTFAYNVDGTLCWTSDGAALPAVGTASIDPNDSSKLVGDAWSYLEGDTKVIVLSAKAGVYQYAREENAVIAVDAYIDRNGVISCYGDLNTVVAAATNGETVEVLRDVTGVKNVSIAAGVTIDGNGHTLYMYNTATPDKEDAIAMFNQAGSATLKNVTLHGGATTKGVWDGALAPAGSAVFGTAKQLTLIDCVITGMRYSQTNTDRGMVFGNGHWNANLYMTNVEITDNIFKLATGDANGYLIRPGSSGYSTVASGTVVIKDNFRINTNGKYRPANYHNNNQVRLILCDLDEESEIHLSGSVGTLLVEIDSTTGKMYDCSGTIFIDKSDEIDADKVLTANYAYFYNYMIWDGSTTVTQIQRTCAPVSVSTIASMDTAKAHGGAQLKSDKFFIDYYIPISADYYGTEVVVQMGEKILLSLPFSSLERIVDETVFGDTTVRYKVPGVGVGMAELADEITVWIKDTKTGNYCNGVSDPMVTSAKEYADRLIATEAVAIHAKNAVASLLQYGAAVQTLFDYNTDHLAMTEADLAEWTAAGVTIKTVKDTALNLTNAKVQATGEGSLPAGVTVAGASLTMENQMSLRLYIAANSYEGLTFTVNGVTVQELGRDKYGSYLEASHIGTGELASMVTFTVSDGEHTYTYKACPMSYVYTVHTSTHANISENLKDACEALYYYYDAVATCFGLTNDTGFDTGLVSAVDPINEYSAPYGIRVA